MEFIKTYKAFKPITEKLSPSEFKTIDSMISNVSSYINDTLGHKEWMQLGNEDKGDVINTAISNFSADNSSDKKLTNLVKKKANDIIDYLVASLSESLVNEGKWSNIMKGVRKGSKSGPWSIVSIENGKVVNQELVDIMDAIPAHYEDVKKKFPKAKMSIEDNEGLSVYNESVDNKKVNSESVTEAKKPIIVIYKGRRLVVEPDEFKRLKLGKDIVGMSSKYPGQEEWILAKGDWKVEESIVTEGQREALYGDPKMDKKWADKTNKLSKSQLQKELDKLHKAGFGSGNQWSGSKEDMIKFQYIDVLLNESLVTESSDLNDPVLVAIRAAKQRTAAFKAWDKANPKKRPLYGKQREKAEDTLWDISLELKDLYAERTSIYSDMNAEAGQKGSNWTDADANRYGGELNRVEDRIEMLIPKRKQLEIKLAQ